MTGVSIFLVYSLRQAQAEIARLSAIVNSNPIKPTFVPEEQLSWKTSYQDNKLVLTIKEITNQSQRQPDEICILSIGGNIEYYLNGNPRKKADKNCEEPSIVTDKKENTWNFEHTFKNQNNRIIRVEKIHNNNTTPKSYIDFTIEKKINQQTDKDIRKGIKN